MLLHIVAFANTMRDLVLTGPRARTPNVLDTPDDERQEPYPQSPPETNVHRDERQTLKSQAAVTSLHQGAVLARLSVPITQMTAEIIEDMRGHYVVPDGDQDPGVESGEYRTRLKRKADSISRSQYEVYSFVTKHNLSFSDFPTLGLLPLPSDRSRVDVHAMLKPMDIQRLLQHLQVILICNNM